MKVVTRKEFQDDFCKTCVYYKNGCKDDMRRNKNLCIIYMLANMFSVGQKVYVEMYDSVGKVVVVAYYGNDFWYGVECIDGKFGMHDCEGLDEEIIESVDYSLFGNKCEWFTSEYLKEV